MKKFSCFSFNVLFYLSSSYAGFAQVKFVSPVPGSGMHYPERNIVIRPGEFLDRSSVLPSLFRINGSISGKHDFKIVLARDGKTINLDPFTPFSPGETVTVSMKEGLRKADGTTLNHFSFFFNIHRPYTQDEEKALELAVASVSDVYLSDELYSKQNPQDSSNPDYEIAVKRNPTPGNVFFNIFNATGGGQQKMWIIGNNGDSIYEASSGSDGFDWKLNHNNYLTTYNKHGAFDMLDSNYSLIKSFKPANGYLPDEHEFQIFPDGHYYLIAKDIQFINMKQYDSTYKSNAKVVGNVIQEFDADNNLIFEWRTFDHIDIPEALHVDLAADLIDAIHMNSIEEDTDGNIIISIRHLDQIDKIDLSTGNFIWRLGGAKNQFEFINDSVRFNYQHDARRLPNGNITLFDNNNYGSPPISSAREYRLDEQNMRAELVWCYLHPDLNGHSINSVAMGSVQRLENGNTLIGWGWIPIKTPCPSITEVDSNNNIVWELYYNSDHYSIMYRAHRFRWAPCSRPSDKYLKALNISSSTARLTWSSATGALKYKLRYRKLGDADWSEIQLSTADRSYRLTGLMPATTYEWGIQTYCDQKGIHRSTYTDSKSFTTSAPKEDLSLNNPELLSLFPNPATDFMTLYWKHQRQTSRINFQLINLMGHVMFACEAEVSDGINIQTFDVRNISRGTYLLRIVDGTCCFETRWIKE